MKKWNLFLGIITLAVLFSCEEGKRPFSHKKEIVTAPFIFKMNQCFTDDEYNLSFPNWFEDSIIREYNISSITRKIFSVSDEVDTTDLELREIRTYDFSKNGQLKGIQVAHYYDNQEVGSITFSIKQIDEYGYAMVTPIKAKSSKEQEEILSQYRIVLKEKYTSKYLAYHHPLSGDYVFYVIDEEMFGPLSVDSILHPTKHDQITLGSPIDPKKRYRVENTVNETDVVEYKYAKDQLVEIVFDEYPFHIQRHVNYDAKGNCLGYIDSTFSDNQFLIEKVARFESQNTLPSKLIHQNKSNSSEASFYQIETFEYTFYP